ncbi:hypothetical protein H9I32_21545 [Bacillus sp. Xin]|uniref:hypothetical protein n=1 Tax=unclassified Bacillus (in: firmicutes) TaxID=185979 RepID=UPI001571A1AE|nr:MULTISPECIES: hypothetical protein [unclassified Bacillus (in: firmicutes)]MBC6974875.1 hypothetical protein [Bacillus sp. Xin]NSW39630.1 hypothetical protein [Bacillus sp. Xin1]
MIVKMKRQEFDQLAQEAIFKACFEPLILVYKNRVAKQNTGDKTMVKEQFYKELTKGQRALFVFKVYYDHASESLAEFYWWSAYFMAQPKIWSAIKAGLQYFGDDVMLLMLEKIEVILKKHNHPSSLEGFTITREELDRNKELLASIGPLHVTFDETAPLTIKIISEYVRNNQREFVQIED